MILNLGVEDVPYSQAPSKRAKKPTAGTVSTGDVATWLENRYHVMEVFYNENQQEIAQDVADSLRGALESVMMGAPGTLDPYGSATSEIEDRFKQFLSQGVMETLGYPGVPTQAALDRRSGKKRSGRFKKRRPGTGVSFIDTGLYQANFKAWIDPT